MSTKTQKFIVCDRCQIQTPIKDDDYVELPTGWFSIAINPLRTGLHLCPDCSTSFNDFMDMKEVN